LTLDFFHLTPLRSLKYLPANRPIEVAQAMEELIDVAKTLRKEMRALDNAGLEAVAAIGQRQRSIAASGRASAGMLAAWPGQIGADRNVVVTAKAARRPRPNRRDAPVSPAR
jgi:hypothetical protein